MADPQNWWDSGEYETVQPVARTGGPVPIVAAPVDPNKASQEARAQAGEERAQSAEARAQETSAREQAKFEAEMTGKGGKPTEAQQKAATLVTRIAGGFQDIQGVVERNKEAQAPGLVETVRGGLSPVGVLAPITRGMAGPDRRAVYDAQRDMLDALLTLGTGAAYSPEQLQAEMGGYFPQYGDTQDEIDMKNNRLERLLEAAKENAGPLAPKIDEVLVKYQIKPAAAAQPEQMAISGGERFSTETDLAIAQAVNQAFAQGAGVQQLAEVAQAAGAQVTPADLAAFQQAVEARDKGQGVTFNPQQTGQRNPLEQAAGEFAMTPAGTALVGGVNAAGLGLLSQFAGDQVQGLEALNPASALTGEIIGSALGTGALAKGAGMGLKAVAPSMAERLAGGGAAGALGRTAATDAAYGGIYAANTGEDIGTGAALGAAGSLLGAGAGKVAGRVLGRGAGEIPPSGGGGMGAAVPEGMPPSGGAMPEPAMGGAPDIAPTEPTFGASSAGAARLTEDAIRAQRAAELPVPVELARFQRSRLFEEQQRARELAKNNAVGGPIRERLAQQQEALRQNFDKFIDETGSEVWESPREKGIVVDNALKKLANVGKARIRVLYKRAEKAGELQEPVQYGDLTRYINEQTPTTRDTLAPVLKAVQEQIAKNDPDGTGAIPINALEDVRKVINKVAQEGTPNATFGREMKGIIDSLTEGKGGELYQQARKARIDYANTFENAGLVKQLIGLKPGTTDRRVALENVAEKAIYSGATSVDDIKALKGVLDQASTRGERAWRELQGATLEHIRDQAYKGITRDESGQVVISPAALNKTITQLDRAGKLDYVFGAKTAELLRTINQVSQDMFTAPPGSVNASGTSSALLNGIDTLATFGASGLPIPAMKIMGGFKEAMKNRGLRKEVKRLLD